MGGARMRLGFACALVAPLAVVAPATAETRTVTTSPDALVAGPFVALGGSAVVVGAGNLVVGSTRNELTVVDVASGGEQSLGVPSVAGVRLAGARALVPTGDGTFVVRSLVDGSDAALTTTPATEGCAERISDAALDGDRVAFVTVPTCGQGPQRVVARDLAAGRTTVLASGPSLRGVRVAGRIVSWIADTEDGLDEATVADADSGGVLYRVPRVSGTRTLAFAPQSDGQGAITWTGTGGAPLLGSTSPAQPGRRLVSAGEEGVDLVGGQILAQRYGRGIDLIALDGSQRKVAQFDDGVRQVGGVDFDGRSVTYAAVRPAVAAVHARARRCRGKGRARRCAKARKARAGIPAQTVVSLFRP